MSENKKEKETKEKIMDISSIEVGEDATKYGEFISSFFDWNTLENQKKKASKLENITKDKKDDTTDQN